MDVTRVCKSSSQKAIHVVTLHCNATCFLDTFSEKHEGDTPPFWYAVFRGDLDGTQYAKGRYAVRRNSVISYADIIFTLKRSNLH